MTSDPEHLSPDHVFVWVWLPGQPDPVVCGRLDATPLGRSLRATFTYGRSYLARPNAIALSASELPLTVGPIEAPGARLPGCIRDASPDAWGRRVIINRLSTRSAIHEDVDLDELVYLLESGSGRIGALDFQTSATNHSPREEAGTPIGMLLEAAELVERGIPLSPELDRAILHGTSIGGARPKAGVTGGDAKFVAKFGSTTDTYNVVRAEAAAMRLARDVGIEVADVELIRVLEKDVLLVRRFDRDPIKAAETRRDDEIVGWSRRLMASALTLLGLDEMEARYAGYDRLASVVRRDFRDPRADLSELFRRLVFNIAIGNTDDHARNHAAFHAGSATT